MIVGRRLELPAQSGSARQAWHHPARPVRDAVPSARWPSERLTQRRQRHDRRRRARRRAVDDADEDARRRGDDGADRRARVGRLRGRPRRRTQARGRRGAAADRPALAASGHRRHPFQRVARAQGDRGRGGGGAGSTRATSAGRTRRPRSSSPPRQAGIPMRIGANAGSLPKHLEELARKDAAEALVVEALEQVELLERLEFRDFKISVKASHVPTMIRAYRMLSAKVPYPAASRRDRGRDAVRRLDQERRRHGRAAHGRDRRHDPRLPHRRPCARGRGRLGDPQGAGPPRARPGHDRLPLVRARQRRGREPRRGRRGAAQELLRRRSRSR